MAYRAVPVTLGSPQFRTLEAGGFNVVDARFPPNLWIPPHIHERATMAVMLEGSFDCVFPSRSVDCLPSTVHTEPAEERHGNRVGTAGAHVLVVQPDRQRTDALRPHTGLLDSINHLPGSPAPGIAWRLSRELHTPDQVAPIAIEGLVLELLALLGRHTTPSGSRAPSWLARTRDLLHGRFGERLRVIDIADEVQVHPVHLARVFRQHYGVSIGTYVRRLRIDWSAVRLASSDESLSAVAARAGFTDQSHFTRHFKAHLGLTPGRYISLQRAA